MEIALIPFVYNVRGARVHGLDAVAKRTTLLVQKIKTVAMPGVANPRDLLRFHSRFREQFAYFAPLTDGVTDGKFV